MYIWQWLRLSGLPAAIKAGLRPTTRCYQLLHGTARISYDAAARGHHGAQCTACIILTAGAGRHGPSRGKTY
jgi:hypothetical protein